MKILHVNKFYYPHGGTETYMMALMEEQQRQGHEIAIFAMEDPRNLPTPWNVYFSEPVKTNFQFPISNFQLWSSAFRFVYNRQARQKFEEILDAFQPDVVHLHNYYHHLSVAILKPLIKRKIPAVQTLHDYHIVDPTYKFYCNGKVFEQTKGGKYWKIIAPKCIHRSRWASILETIEFTLIKKLGWDTAAVQSVICPTVFLQKKIIEYGVPPEKTVVVAHPAFSAKGPGSSDQPPPGRDPAVAGVSEPRVTTTIDVLYVGRISEEKGVDLLLQAMSHIDNPSVRLHIVGDGPERARLERLATNLHLTTVEFHGRLVPVDVAAWYDRAAFVVLPTQWYEVSPMVIGEAAAHGKCVVASTIGGLPELIDNGSTGMLVEPANIALWAQRIQWLAEHPADAARMGQNAQARYASNTMEKHLEEIERVYEMAIKFKS
ncbi:glycosyltransferase family 4 protein [Candidatus Uhrbacteria bacterium]|nr:glycosyltransferase family 4 protein [Candidatus Uhrbacteria bacterium]